MEKLKAPGKPFVISKRAVQVAWEKVKANGGAAGVDGVSSIFTLARCRVAATTRGAVPSADGCYRVVPGHPSNMEQKRNPHGLDHYGNDHDHNGLSGLRLCRNRGAGAA